MGFSGGNSGGTMSDINVTPLVDVMLVLLIIFMVTAPMLNNAGIEIDLPQADTPPLDMDDEDQLILSVDADSQVYINDQETPFDIDELGTRLQAIAKANPDQPVFLRAHGDLAYRDVVRVLEVAKGAGMPRVGLVFEPLGKEEEE
jgi:biopolymer transport protein TolR